MIIKIKRDPGQLPLERHGDWIDLRAARDTFVPLRACVAVPLGVRMRMPEGYEAIVAPRSSTFKRYGLIAANGIGIIDNSYCGNDDEWHFLAYCLEPHDVLNGKEGTLIRENERICQFRVLQSMPGVRFRDVEDLQAKSRGGIGSTGVQ